MLLQPTRLQLPNRRLKPRRHSLLHPRDLFGRGQVERNRAAAEREREDGLGWGLELAG